MFLHGYLWKIRSIFVLFVTITSIRTILVYIKWILCIQKCKVFVLNLEQIEHGNPYIVEEVRDLELKQLIFNEIYGI